MFLEYLVKVHVDKNRNAPPEKISANWALLFIGPIDDDSFWVEKAPLSSSYLLPMASYTAKCSSINYVLREFQNLLEDIQFKPFMLQKWVADISWT